MIPRISPPHALLITHYSLLVLSYFTAPAVKPLINWREKMT